MAIPDGQPGPISPRRMEIVGYIGAILLIIILAIFTPSPYKGQPLTQTVPQDVIGLSIVVSAIFFIDKWLESRRIQSSPTRSET